MDNKANYGVSQKNCDLGFLDRQKFLTKIQTYKPDPKHKALMEVLGTTYKEKALNEYPKHVVNTLYDEDPEIFRQIMSPASVYEVADDFKENIPAILQEEADISKMLCNLFLENSYQPSLYSGDPLPAIWRDALEGFGLRILQNTSGMEDILPPENVNLIYTPRYTPNFNFDPEADVLSDGVLNQYKEFCLKMKQLVTFQMLLKSIIKHITDKTLALSDKNTHSKLTLCIVDSCVVCYKDSFFVGLALLDDIPHNSNK